MRASCATISASVCSTPYDRTDDVVTLAYIRAHSRMAKWRAGSERQGPAGCHIMGRIPG